MRNHYNSLIELKDPDTFVQWRRVDEPGENPKWESQCGYVEQIGFGDHTTFQGFVAPDFTPLDPKVVLTVAKKEVERMFQKTNTLTWSYQD